MRSLISETGQILRPSPVLRAIVTAAAFAALGAGCESSKLETGYTPKPLNASDAERRAYYSGKYTKESVKADQEREAEFRSRRPGI
jgi:hypothetical protein